MRRFSRSKPGSARTGILRTACTGSGMSPSTRIVRRCVPVSRRGRWPRYATSRSVCCAWTVNTTSRRPPTTTRCAHDYRLTWYLASINDFDEALPPIMSSIHFGQIPATASTLRNTNRTTNPHITTEEELRLVITQQLIGYPPFGVDGTFTYIYRTDGDFCI